MKNTAGTTKRSHQSASAQQHGDRHARFPVSIAAAQCGSAYLDTGVPAIDLRISVSACTLRNL